MAVSKNWITAGVALVAVGLFVDNMRLRTELSATHESTASSSNMKDASKQAAETSPRQSKRSAAADQAQAANTPTPDPDEIEAQIEAEVDARLETAINERLGKGMDALVEERVEARMDQRHQDRRERFRAAMDEHIADFVEEHSLTDETEANLVTVMDGAMESLGDVFRSMSSGELEREDAREEFGAIRDDMAESLTELLGADAAEAFQEDMRGPLGWRGPRGR